MNPSHTISFKNQSPSMDVGMTGVQKQFTGHPLHYLLDSSWFLSRIKALSTAWVKLANSLVSILDCIQLSRSFGSVIDLGTRILVMYDTSLHEHINITYCMSCNVLHDNTHMNEGDMNEWNEN